MKLRVQERTKMHVSGRSLTIALCQHRLQFYETIMSTVYLYNNCYTNLSSWSYRIVLLWRLSSSSVTLHGGAYAT